MVLIIAGPIRFTVFPRKKKDRKPKEKVKKEKKPKQSKEKQEPAEQKKEQGGSLLDFIPLVKVAVDLLNGFRRKLRVNRLELKLILAADDPCDLGINYGRTYSLVGNLLPWLEQVFVITKYTSDASTTAETAPTETTTGETTPAA